MVICLEQGADLHMTQLMPLPLTVSCFSKIQIGFTFLVPAHPCSLGQMAVKRVCVCKWHANSCELHYFRYGGPSPWRAELACYIPHVRWQASTIIITTVLRPLYRSTCVSRYLLLRTRGFCWCKVLTPTSLLTATSAFGLGRRCWSSPQQCYLHCLHTLSCHKRIVNVLPLFDEMAIPLFFLATLLADLLSSPSQCLCETDNTVLILFL